MSIATGEIFRVKMVRTFRTYTLEKANFGIKEVDLT